MRLIAFGDVHMAPHVIGTIPDVKNADILIANGDLTNYGKQKDAKTVLDQILRYNSNLLALIGNLDNYEINDYLEEIGLNLHRQARLIKGKICLMGVGGSNFTPFQTPVEFSEAELTEIIQDCYDQARGFISLAEPLNKHRIPLVFVSHAPPRNTAVDRIRDGRHVGSTAVRKFIEKHQPDVCITGHIHEGRGEDRIGKTHILNPGMLRGGGWVEIQLINQTLQATLHR